MTFLNVLALSLPFLAPQPMGTPPKATLKFDKPAAVAGANVRATLTLVFAEGLHGYPNPPADDTQIPVKVEAVKGGTLKLVKVAYPEGSYMGNPKTVPKGEKLAKVYFGTVKIPLILVTPKNPGLAKAKLRVSYQLCTEESCFPPESLDLKASLKVLPAKKK